MIEKKYLVPVLYLVPASRVVSNRFTNESIHKWIDSQMNRFKKESIQKRIDSKMIRFTKNRFTMNRFQKRFFWIDSQMNRFIWESIHIWIEWIEFYKLWIFISFIKFTKEKLKFKQIYNYLIEFEIHYKLDIN